MIQHKRESDKLWTIEGYFLVNVVIKVRVPDQVMHTQKSCTGIEVKNSYKVICTKISVIIDFRYSLVKSLIYCYLRLYSH